MGYDADKLAALNPHAYRVFSDPKRVDVQRTYMPAGTPCLRPHCGGKIMEGYGHGIACNLCGRGMVTIVSERES